MADDVRTLQTTYEAACAGFGAKDLDAYFGGVHPSAATFQAGTFMTVDELRALAPAILERSVRFDVARWVGGLAIGDTGVVWGEFEFEVLDDADGTTTRTGSFSASYTRVDGTWQLVFSHYTPSS